MEVLKDILIHIIAYIFGGCMFIGLILFIISMFGFSKSIADAFVKGKNIHIWPPK